MKIAITKDFDFSASHALETLPASHKCFNMHGHNYKVTVELRGDIQSPHLWLVDYADLDPIGDYIDETFDHKHLNDALFTPSPTAEMLATRIAHDIKGKRIDKLSEDVSKNIFSVTVKETEGTSATCWP